MAKNVRPLYDAVVMLDGSSMHMVAVDGVTAAELNVLRVLHGASTGSDPIVSVKATGKGVDRSDEQERARIANRYNAPGAQGGLAILNSLFGVGNKLPKEYEAPVAAGELPEEAEETIVDLPSGEEDAPEEEVPAEAKPEEPVSAPPPKPVINKKSGKASVLDDEDS